MDGGIIESDMDRWYGKETIQKYHNKDVIRHVASPVKRRISTASLDSLNHDIDTPSSSSTLPDVTPPKLGNIRTTEHVIQKSSSRIRRVNIQSPEKRVQTDTKNGRTPPPNALKMVPSVRIDLVNAVDSRTKDTWLTTPRTTPQEHENPHHHGHQHRTSDRSRSRKHNNHINRHSHKYIVDTHEDALEEREAVAHHEHLHPSIPPSISNISNFSTSDAEFIVIHPPRHPKSHSSTPASYPSTMASHPSTPTSYPSTRTSHPSTPASSSTCTHPPVHSQHQRSGDNIESSDISPHNPDESQDDTSTGFHTCHSGSNVDENGDYIAFDDSGDSSNDTTSNSSRNQGYESFPRRNILSMESMPVTNRPIWIIGNRWLPLIQMVTLACVTIIFITMDHTVLARIRQAMLPKKMAANSDHVPFSADTIMAGSTPIVLVQEVPFGHEVVPDDNKPILSTMINSIQERLNTLQSYPSYSVINDSEEHPPTTSPGTLVRDGALMAVNATNVTTYVQAPPSQHLTYEASESLIHPVLGHAVPSLIESKPLAHPITKEHECAIDETRSVLIQVLQRAFNQPCGATRRDNTLNQIPSPARSTVKVVYIIRHAEKNIGIRDHHLNSSGKIRAEYLVNVFGGFMTKYQHPKTLMANQPKKHGASMNSVETLEPLARKLDITINTDYSRMDTDDTLRTAILGMPSPILIAWEHHDIYRLANVLVGSNVPVMERTNLEMVRNWSGSNFGTVVSLNIDRNDPHQTTIQIGDEALTSHNFLFYIQIVFGILILAMVCVVLENEFCRSRRVRSPRALDRPSTEFDTQIIDEHELRQNMQPLHEPAHADDPPKRQYSS